MKGVAVLIFLSASLALASAGNVVCGFVSWTIYRADEGAFAAKDVDPTLCTHILYTYVGLTENATINILDDWEITGLGEIANLMSLKEENPDLKILFSMGGYNEESETYSAVVADPDLRATLIESVISFIEENQFDGFDLAWQYPGLNGGDEENDPANYITLLEELTAAFNDSGYILSVTVSGYGGFVDVAFPDGEAISDNTDMINVMSYEYHGSWDTFVGHPSPLNLSSLDITSEQQLHNVVAGIQHWIDSGADPKKINIGIATFGRSFTLDDPLDAELYAPVNGSGEAGPLTQDPGMLGYNEICALDLDEWEYVWDDEQQVPHIVNGDQWVGYENVESIELKIQYANELGLGGAFVWSLDTDDFLGTCGDENYPLLRAVNDNLD